MLNLYPQQLRFLRRCQCSSEKIQVTGYKDKESRKNLLPLRLCRIRRKTI